EDGYFVSARVLAYQLLHSPTVRGNISIPFLVLVTEDVSQRKRDRLTRDGATVIQVEKLYSEWITPRQGRWRDVLTKLRLFEMTQYDRICFIDADHLVTQSLEGVFDDPAAMVQTTLQIPSIMDEASLPDSYVFASKTEAGGYDHPYPPEEGNYLNIGFFVLRPDKMLFDYYVTLMQTEYSTLFSSDFPEQNLMNYAHRKEGRMPWHHLWYGWNMNWPTENDLRGGAHSFHAKYWD
ncbi:glycosyltransferase family 8 protein, partial [Lepidopterella palustris CBS 459.81]